MKFVLITVCAFSLVGAACKKKEEVKATEPAGSAAGDMKPTDKPAETKPAETKPAETAPAGAMTTAEYEIKNVEMADKMLAAFTSGGTDCAKVAANVSKFIDDNKATMDAMTAFEKANPEAKKAAEEKHKEKSAALQAKVEPLMMACKDSKELAAALEKIPED